MVRKVVIRIAVLAVVVFLNWIALTCMSGISQASSSYSLLPYSSPMASPPALSQQPHVTNTTYSIDPVVLAALIGLIGALIAGIFVIYQVHFTAKMEQQRQEYQRKYEQKIQEDHEKNEQKIQEQQFQHDQEMARLQKELEEQYKSKEREEEREATKIEAIRLRMLLAQTNDERAKAYRQALHADPHISRLQILDMNRPLEVTNIYVRLRVHQDSRLGYELDPALRLAEAYRDPKALLEASFRHLERRSMSGIDPDEAIRVYKHCVIVGDPGAGKTTLLKYLALKSADNRLDKLPDLPIHIELNAFALSDHRNLIDFAAANWDERYGFPIDDARLYITEKMQDGNAFLLLDALDETLIGDNTMEAEASYQRVTDAIMQVITRYNQVPIVVTARKAGYQQRTPLIGFTELEVLDFRLEDMQQFVTNWFSSHQDTRKRIYATELNTKLEQNPRIQALGANPLLLSLIIIVYEAQLDLPERRASLYRRCVDTLLTEWDAKRDIRRRREFQPEHKRQLLAEIAWHFHSQGLRYFPDNEILEVIANFLPKVHLHPEQNMQVLLEIAGVHGLLKEQARGWQGFLHLTLQEYFVAQYVTDHQQLDVLLAHRGDPWWEEVLVLYTGSTADASPLLRKLLGEDDGQIQEDLFQTNLILAGRCLAARPTIQQISLWETVIDRLFESLIGTAFPLTQALIAEALAAIGGSEINKRLLQLLSNTQIDLNVRARIAEALGRSGELAVVPELVELLSNKQLSLTVREQIAEALGRSGGRLVVRLLSNTQLDLRVRECIAEALGRCEEQTHATVPEMVRLLSDTQIEVSIRKHIANSLGILGERSIALKLVQLLSNQQIDVEVRKQVASTLGVLGERTVAVSLVDMLSDKWLDLSIRECIALALGALGELTIAPNLVELLSDEQVNASVRKYIAQSLGALGERSIALKLVSMLSNPQIDVEVRECIASALGVLGERTIATDLVDMLYDKQLDLSIREHIALALGELGEVTITDRLMDLLLDKHMDLNVRKSVAEALGGLGARTIAPNLMRLLLDTQLDLGLRESVALALGKLGEHTVATELVQLISNEQVNEYVRKRIAEALGMLGERSIVQDLLQLLSNEQIKVSVREYIIETLVILGERSIVPDFMQLLPNEQINEAVRAHIATNLGNLGEKSIVSTLMRLLYDEHIHISVRARIGDTLRKLGKRVAVPEQSQLHSNQQVDLKLRSRITEVMHSVEERSPELVQLLANKQIALEVRGRIAETLSQLSEHSVIPELIQLVSDKQIDLDVRTLIAEAIGTMVKNEEDIYAFATLLQISDVANAVHQALWTASRRVGVRIFMIDGLEGKELKIVKW